MSNFKKKTWKKERITVEDLNRMEEGIANANKEKSAYEYAKAGGYTGTEAEFIEELGKKYMPDVIMTDVFPLQDLEYTGVAQHIESGADIKFWSMDISSPIEGETYYVYYNGAIYTCTCFCIENTSEPDKDSYYLGNPWILTIGEDNGMPFIIGRGESAEIGFLATFSMDTTCTVRVYQSEPAVKLPAVTEADNGKIVQVVDGKYAVVSVEDSAIAAYISAQLSAQS